jgi:hypothetical protein
MTTVDQRFLSVRDLLQDGRICLDGPLISDATKFAVECLNLPQSVDTICERAGITRDVYNHYADILNNLFKGFNTMFEIADDFGVSFLPVKIRLILINRRLSKRSMLPAKKR